MLSSSSRLSQVLSGSSVLNLSTSTIANMEESIHRCHILVKLRLIQLRVSIKLKPLPNHFLKRIQTDSLFCQSSTMTSGRCTRSRWPASGQLRRLTWLRILKIGKVSQTMRGTLSSMFLHFSLPLMVLFSKTLLRDSWLKSRYQKLVVFTDSKWWWKTSTVKHILYSLIHTFKIILKKNSFSKPLRTFHQSQRRQNGLLNGSVQAKHSLKESLLSPVSRESSSLEVSVPSFG